MRGRQWSAQVLTIKTNKMNERFGVKDVEYEWKVGKVCPRSVDLVRALAPGSTVADIGCYGWLLGEASAASGATLIGVDHAEPPGRPPHARFEHGSNTKIDLDDDSCDVVIAGHVLEHVFDGIGFGTELLRILKPGGLLWIETPSELGCQAVSTDDPQDQSFHSFWDDPTHIRPWTPGALYRLAISCHAYPLAIQRTQTGDVPSSTMLARKPSFIPMRLTARFAMTCAASPRPHRSGVSDQTLVAGPIRKRLTNACPS